MEPKVRGEESSAASLAGAVLDEEATRQAAQDDARQEIVFPDDLLPGVAAAPMTWSGDNFTT